MEEWNKCLREGGRQETKTIGSWQFKTGQDSETEDGIGGLAGGRIYGVSCLGSVG